MSTTAEQVSHRSVPDAEADAPTRRTVDIAMASNGIIAVAKLAAGLMTGSSAMLAEAAHSIGDTVNQGFLRMSLNLSAEQPTPGHPFGRGQERFLWTLMAAVGMFLAGAAFAVGYGIYELLHPGESEQLPARLHRPGALVRRRGHLVAAGAAPDDGRGEKGRQALREYVRSSRDPNTKMVLFEDTAALAGLAIAAGGLILHQLTGVAAFDSGASILIGLMLMVVAFFIARDSRHLLLGASALPEEREAIERVIECHPGIEQVQELLTLVLGPKALLVAARVDLRNDLSGDEVERISSEIEDQIRDAVADVTEVFLDATPSRACDPAPA